MSGAIDWAGTAIDDASAFVDPRHDEFLGGALNGPTPASANTPGWNTGPKPVTLAPGTVVAPEGGQLIGATVLPEKIGSGATEGAMENQQRSALHYQPGVGMSEPLTELGERGQARGDAAETTLGGYGRSAAQAGNVGMGLGMSGLDAATAQAGQISSAGQTALGIGGEASTTANRDARRVEGAADAAVAYGDTAARQGIAGGQAISGAGQQTLGLGTTAAAGAQQAASQIGLAGQQAMQMGQTGAQLAQGAARQTAQAGTAGQQSLTALGQQTGQFGMSAAQQGQSFLGDRGYQAQMGDANAARGQAQAAAGRLQGIEAQEGPSAAQAQLRQGLNQAQSSNLAMARSGKGFGGSASALSQAQNANAQAGQQAANQSAMLRASENAAFRQRQAANLGAAGGLQLGAGQQAMSREQMLGQQQLAQTESNRQSYLQSQGLGLNALGQQIGAEAQGRQMALAGAQQAGQLGVQGSQLGLSGAQTAVGAQQAAGQLGLAGDQAAIGASQANIGAQQAATAAAMQGSQLGMQGAGIEVGANQAAGALRQQGYGQSLQSAGMDIGAQTAAGQLGVQGAQLGMGGAALGMQGQQVGGQLAGAGYGMGFQGDQQMGQAIGMDMAAKLAYEQMLTQQMGIEAGVSVGNAQAQNLWNAGMLNAAGTGIGMVGSALIPSDVNAKTEITPVGANDNAFGAPSAFDTTVANESAVGRGQQMANYDPSGGAPSEPFKGPKNPGKLDPSAAMSGIGSPTLGAGMGNAMIDTQKQGVESMDESLASISRQGEPDMYNLPLTSMYRAPSPFGFGFEPMGVMSDKRAKTGYAVSDEKAKRDAGEMVDKLDPYAFKYKDPGKHGAGQHFGIMAQDLERSPAGKTVVEEGPDGLKRVNTPKLTMLNSAALAQYDDRLGELEARIAKMGGKKKRAA